MLKIEITSRIIFEHEYLLFVMYKNTSRKSHRMTGLLGFHELKKLASNYLTKRENSATIFIYKRAQFC